MKWNGYKLKKPINMLSVTFIYIFWEIYLQQNRRCYVLIIRREMRLPLPLLVEAGLGFGFPEPNPASTPRFVSWGLFYVQGLDGMPQRGMDAGVAMSIVNSYKASSLAYASANSLNPNSSKLISTVAWGPSPLILRIVPTPNLECLTICPSLNPVSLPNALETRDVLVVCS